MRQTERTSGWSEPETEEVEEGLAYLPPQPAAPPFVGLDLRAALEIALELALQLGRHPRVDQLQRHFPVVVEAARVEVVRADGGSDGVDAESLGVQDVGVPLEDAQEIGRE